MTNDDESLGIASLLSSPHLVRSLLIRDRSLATLLVPLQIRARAEIQAQAQALVLLLDPVRLLASVRVLETS